MNFRNFIEKYTLLNDSDWNTIDALCEKVEYQKNDVVLQIGKTCKYFYFLENGLVRFYNYNDGDDITKTFAIAPYCFTSKISFRKQTPSDEEIQALDKAVVWTISYDSYKRLEAYSFWNVFIRKLLNEIQEFSEEFYFEIRTMTAEERYKRILKDYPEKIIDKIPLKYLSSFLGIAPQSLSRIRKNIKISH